MRLELPWTLLEKGGLWQMTIFQADVEAERPALSHRACLEVALVPSNLEGRV